MPKPTASSHTSVSDTSVRLSMVRDEYARLTAENSRVYPFSEHYGIGVGMPSLFGYKDNKNVRIEKYAG